MIVDRFLELDLENGDLISFLSNVVLPISEGQIWWVDLDLLWTVIAKLDDINFLYNVSYKY